jgi:hypothetical protein
MASPEKEPNFLTIDEAGFRYSRWRFQFECGFQQRFLINVWVGIINWESFDKATSHVLPHHLNGEKYVFNFLQNVLNDLLDDVPLLFRRDPVTFLWGHLKQIV